MHWLVWFMLSPVYVVYVFLRVVFSVVVDVLLLPVAGVLVLMALLWKSNFDPLLAKPRVPILLLHGNDFNETEWIVGKCFLDRAPYGSVFTMNYDPGLVRHNQAKGPEDYAMVEVKGKVEEILGKSGAEKVILIGHSMGGLVAAEYATRHKDQVKCIISISTPWKGSPLLGVFNCLPCFSSKRYIYMTPDSEELRRIHQELAQLPAEVGLYNICSTVDPMVPGVSGLLPGLQEERLRVFGYLGHYGIMVWPWTWWQVCEWLDDVYKIGGEEQNESYMDLERRSS
eukprot:TRINITY_DN5367_c0_g1_i1.p1 TRINITY_DN5367_c0_g1~~TRINITY_DN5367_c0_g1_i1.p1  ORF type:complete len:284 (+),score=52.67 TRINITY_DN5367_c0_g1_i1:82-933(+)